jgi:hypothetical protein
VRTNFRNEEVWVVEAQRGPPARGALHLRAGRLLAYGLSVQLATPGGGRSGAADAAVLAASFRVV